VKEGKGLRPPSMCTPVKVDELQVAMQRSPGQSTTKAYRDFQFNAFFIVIWNKVLDFCTTLSVHVSSHTVILIVATAVILATPQPRLEPMRLLFVGFALPMRSANLMDLRATIIQLCGEITEDLYLNIITNIGDRFQ
jgi:hypothetical protein